MAQTAQRKVIVVGGGVMGLATGCALAGRGAEVTVLERYTIAHDWASSHGLSRAIRHEYGPLAIYTQMVARSLVLWDELARETQRHLYTETGVLTLGRADDGETLQGYEVMRAAGLPVELLSPEACQQRFPQFTPHEYDAITYNPKEGFLAATECVQALAQRLQRRGGELREGVRVQRIESVGDSAHVTLEDGTIVTADRVVVTAGPWIHDVLPAGMTLPVRATRQQVGYFRGLPASSFGVGVFPIFLAAMDYYGFPLHGGGLFKAGIHIYGDEVDPNQPYDASMAEVEQLRTFFRKVIPMAADAPFEMVDRCMYDVSPDEDFILDQLPTMPGIILGSGFSGHGFKFGILIGELLAALALDETPAFPLERFRLNRFYQHTS